MIQPNLDRSFYLIMARMGNADIFLERTLQDAMSLPETVLDILHGQVEDVHYVIEMNPAEGWSRNVTETVAESLALIVNAKFNADGDRPDRALQDFIQKHSNVRIPQAA